jgi:ABC-type antimicrobial peptide transport system permease subunit
MLYTPLQAGGNFLSAEFRIAAPAAAVAPALRKTFEDEGILVRDIRTLDERAGSTIAMDRILASLAAVFGALALALAAAGLYGLLAYANARRTAEFGLRLAFGATRSHILRRVLGEASTLVFIGIAIGLPAALAAARLTRSTLYGLEPDDPATIAVIAAALLATALLAASLPAWRASRVDPAAALRHD